MNGERTDLERLGDGEPRLRDSNAVSEPVLARSRTWAVSPDIMGVVTAEGYFEQSNPAWAAVLGWSEEEVAKDVFFNFIHPEDQERTRAAWDEAIERGSPALRFENRYRHKAGGWRWLSWVAVPEDGKVYCSARDITVEKEQAEALAARTAERDRMWETSPDLMLVIDFNGVFQRVNPAWTTLLGYAPEDVVGHHVNEFVIPEDHAETVDAYKLAAAGGLPVIVNGYRHKDGSTRWISWVAAPAGDMTYATGRDVTAERERATVLRHYQEIIEATVAPICAFDTDYRIVAFNGAHETEFRRVNGAGSKVGDVFPDMFIPAQRALLRELMGRALSGESFTVRAELGRPELGVPCWEINYTPLRDEAGRVVGAFHHATDISKRLLAEAELESAREALRQSQKMEAVGQLTGGIAHDFNNLLAAISGSLQVMKMKLARGRTEDLGRHIDVGETSVRRAAALTQRLLAFSRRQTLDPKPVNVNRLVSSMEDLIRRTIGPSIELAMVVGGGLWTTRVDPSQLENVLLNLCINARDAMLPLGGRLTVETANKWLDDRAAAERDLPSGPYISLCVSDTGTGIKPDVLKRIFDPFFTTKPTGQGTGLGLSMVYGFARQSGGQVRADTEVGHGTTMCLYLPRHVGEAEDDTAHTPAAPVAQSDGETVVVVEDEDPIRQLIVEVFEGAGYRVLQAADGPAGLRILQAKGRIDLLVTDVGLPGGLNGCQVADAGRALRPALKVLFLTGYAENAAVGNGLMEPGMQVMTKPFNLEGLTLKVREMLLASGPGTSASPTPLPSR